MYSTHKTTQHIRLEPKQYVKQCCFTVMKYASAFGHMDNNQVYAEPL